MIEKYSLFSPSGMYGEPLFNVIDFGHNTDHFEKTAGVHPEILAYKSQLEPEKGKTYVHILALGAGEYYGPNLNNDFFNWNGLSHDHTKTPHQYIHGYKTFLNAHAFAHHVNKDPEKAYGDVLLSVLNHKMKRVELIASIDHAKCIRNGGGKVLERILAGEYPSTSMGCRVPYDVCSICGNKAKTREQYCDHMKLEAGKIYPDGRKVFVYNEFPKFFDISFVFIGADRTSFVLEKVAGFEKVAGDSGLGKSLRKKSGTVQKRLVPRMKKKVARTNRYTPRPVTFGKINTMLNKSQKSNAFSQMSNLSKSPRSNLVFTQGPEIIIKKGKEEVEAVLEKQSNLKIAESIKHSDIFKDVNSLPMGKAVPMLVGKERNIPKPIIGKLAKSPDLGNSLSQAASMGIVLKPKEFQRTLLTRIGKEDMADELEERGMHFPIHPGMPMIRSARIKISPQGGVSPEMMDMLGPMMQDRSAITPLALRRITIIRSTPNNFDEDIDQGIDHPILQRIGGLYNGYRSDLLDNIQGIMEGIKGPVMRQIEKARGGSYLDGSDEGLMQSLYAVPVAYFAHAYWDRCCCDSLPEDFALSFTEKNPNIARYLAEWVANRQ
jgi:hypothetical protein